MPLRVRGCVFGTEGWGRGRFTLYEYKVWRSEHLGSSSLFEDPCCCICSGGLESRCMTVSTAHQCRMWLWVTDVRVHRLTYTVT